jgi:hypothetical protein
MPAVAPGQMTDNTLHLSACLEKPKTVFCVKGIGRVALGRDRAEAGSEMGDLGANG